MCSDALKPQLRAIMITLLTRLQTSKTDKYEYLFAYFVLYSMAIDVRGLEPDMIIGAMEEVQQG
jgi:exportin-2 (importin alpha re-exporter)